MPRLVAAGASGLLIVLMAAGVMGGVALAAGDMADGGDRDQGHVDFSIGGTELFGEKGEDHVDFSTGESGSDGCEDRGNSHVDFTVAAEGAFNLGAVLWLGGQRADILGASGEAGAEHESFRITVHPDGRVDVNGEELALCNPAEGCRINLAWSAGTGALVVQIDAADGSLVAAQYHLAEAPSELRVEAAEIRWLSLTPQ